MPEFTLKLDPVTHDLVFNTDKIMAIVEGDDAVAQNVNNTLSTWLGEFILDETHGTDYKRILSQDNGDISDSEAQEVIRDGILQEPQVTLITEVNVSISPKRVLSSSFTGELASGSLISLEDVVQSG